MINLVRIMILKAKIVSFLDKQEGFDHWIALLVVAGLALLIGTVLRAPLASLASTLVSDIQTKITTFFSNSAAGTP